MDGKCSKQAVETTKYMGLIRVNEPTYAEDGTVSGHKDAIVTKMFAINMRQLTIVSKNLYDLHTFPDFTQPLMIPTWTYVEPTQNINHVMGAAYEKADEVFSVQVEKIRQRVLTEDERRERLLVAEDESKSRDMKVEEKEDCYLNDDPSGMVSENTGLTSLGKNVMGWFEIDNATATYAKVYVKIYDDYPMDASTRLKDKTQATKKLGVFLTMFQLAGGVLAQKSLPQLIKTPDTFWDGLTPSDFEDNSVYNLTLSLNALNTWFNVTELPIPNDAQVQNNATYEKKQWSSQRKFDAEAAQIELKRTIDISRATFAQQRNAKAFESRRAKLEGFESECTTAKSTEETDKVTRDEEINTNMKAQIKEESKKLLLDQFLECISIEDGLSVDNSYNFNLCSKKMTECSECFITK